ncbi:uncharacterized protein METZ01_LOCUS317213 [marine metagenome]|uniref:Uncharacterized protein n=1 Tax=marine metagenome TaxID=408172 RepID=A0A382NT67_9ZZZZ
MLVLFVAVSVVGVPTSLDSGSLAVSLPSGVALVGLSPPEQAYTTNKVAIQPTVNRCQPTLVFAMA